MLMNNIVLTKFVCHSNATALQPSITWKAESQELNNANQAYQLQNKQSE